MASGARVGSGCGSGACRGGPPKPPSARQKVVCVTVAINSPVALAVTLRSLSTSAPLPTPLSITSTMRWRPMTVPCPASGRCSVTPCSPLTSLTQSIPVSQSRAQKPDIAEHGGHGRQHLQILFVDEGQLVLVHRIMAEPDAERVEHAILRLIAVLGRRDFEGHQFFVDDGHGRNFSSRVCFYCHHPRRRMIQYSPAFEFLPCRQRLLGAPPSQA